MSDSLISAPKLQRLPLAFYLRTDVVQVAQDLLGKTLVTRFNGIRTTGRITETEAYRAPDDRACHAYGNRRTARTEVMFQEGGRAYIYLCYGIHHLFNVVTGPADTAHAVLIRAVEPLEGLEYMYERRGLKYRPEKSIPTKLTTGPGVLAQALGLHTRQTGASLILPESEVWIEDSHTPVLPDEMASGPRIGVDYAGPCAARPWRFWVKNTPFVKK
ncbi:MAG: DNA-3-methyladenine glycosylase [Saprospiraceae bacterium]|nr:DNA-3-methyladenine glycosylase [Saprospiraceae bacterium]